MSEQLTSEITTLFLVFCRVGASVLLLPGFAGTRIPPTVRLWFALALSIGVTPAVRGLMRSPEGSELVIAIIFNTVIGALLGLLVRIFYLALEFAAHALANFAGYGSVFAQAIDDDQMAGPVSQVITLSAIALFFATDLHLDVIGLLIKSFQMSGGLQAEFAVLQGEVLLTALRESFSLTIQLCAPMVIFSILVNFVFGLLGKMVPQLPIYIVSIPFILVGGLLILYASFEMMSTLFGSAVRSWIVGLGQ